MDKRPAPRFDWFIPIDGDGAHIGTRRAERPPTFEYLRRVGEAAEAEGYYSLLIPTRFANGLVEETAALRALWAKPEPVVFEGSTIRLKGAVVSPGPVGDGPRFYVGGASPRALEFAAKEADAYLAWIQPLEDTGALLERLRKAYAARGRRPAFGLRTHLVVRATQREAWAAAEELMSQVDERVVAQRQAAFAGTQMVGEQAQLRAQPRERAPRLWNGIAKVRVNLGTAIVGDPPQVAAELLAYWRVGVDEVILSGFS